MMVFAGMVLGTLLKVVDNGVGGKLVYLVSEALGGSAG
jgi:hypothetical protein